MGMRYYLQLGRTIYKQKAQFATGAYSTECRNNPPILDAHDMMVAKCRCGDPKIRCTIIRTIVTIVYWGLYWGTLNLGNYQIKKQCPRL